VSNSIADRDDEEEGEEKGGKGKCKRKEKYLEALSTFLLFIAIRPLGAEDNCKKLTRNFISI